MFDFEFSFGYRFLICLMPGVLFLIGWGLVEMFRRCKAWVLDEKYCPFKQPTEWVCKILRTPHEDVAWMGSCTFYILLCLAGAFSFKLRKDLPSDKTN